MLTTRIMDAFYEFTHEVNASTARLQSMVMK